MVKETMTHDTSRGTRVTGLLVASLLAMALMSGCITQENGAQQDDQAPMAALEPSAYVAWDGETFHFNATASEDPNGVVAEWRFEFGDGEKMTVDSRDEANVSHAYERGGEFTVTLTVLDDGANQTGIKTHTVTTTVAVNERDVVAPQIIYAAPVNATGQAGQFNATFDAYDGVDRIAANLSVRSLLVAGMSEVVIKVLGPDNETLINERVEVDAQENQTVLLEAMVADPGDYKLNVTAESGGAEVSGDFALYYDEGFPGAEA